MILIIVTLSEIPINPLYITSGYLFPRFGWFIICVQQSLKLSIGIPNRQTVRKICLVSIKRIWVFVKNIRWSKEDGINYDDRVEKINCFIWSRFSNSFSLKIRRLRKKIVKIYLHPKPFCSGVIDFHSFWNEILPRNIWIFPIWLWSADRQICIVESTSLISR